MLGVHPPRPHPWGTEAVPTLVGLGCKPGGSQQQDGVVLDTPAFSLSG